jgi:hypothetical protein
MGTRAQTKILALIGQALETQRDLLGTQRAELQKVIDRNTLAIQECTARVDAAQRQLADMDSELLEISARQKALADASAP